MGSMMAGQIAGLISKNKAVQRLSKLMAESHEVIQNNLHVLIK